MSTCTFNSAAHGDALLIRLQSECNECTARLQHTAYVINMQKVPSRAFKSKWYTGSCANTLRYAAIACLITRLLACLLLEHALWCAGRTDWQGGCA